MLNNRHFGAVGHPQYLRRDYPGGRAFGQNMAVETNQPGQMGRHRVDFVSGHNHGNARMVQLVQQVHHLITSFYVNPAGRLIQQEQSRVADQGAGQEHPLLLSARQFPDVPPVQVRDAQPFHHLISRIPVLPPVPGEQGVAAGAAHHHNFLHRHREVPVNGFQLRNVAGMSALVDRRRAIDRHLPLENPHRPQDGAEQGGLTGSAGAQQTDKITGHNPQVYVGKHLLALIAGGNVFQFYYWLPRPALVGIWM